MCDSLCRCTIFLICQENDGAPANGLQKECKVSLSQAFGSLPTKWNFLHCKMGSMGSYHSKSPVSQFSRQHSSLCYWLRTLLGLAQIRKPMGFLGDGSCWHHFALEPSRSRYAKTWAVRMCNLCNPPVVRSWNDKMPNHRHQLVVWCKLSSPPLTKISTTPIGSIGCLGWGLQAKDLIRCTIWILTSRFPTVPSVQMMHIFPCPHPNCQAYQRSHLDTPSASGCVQRWGTPHCFLHQQFQNVVGFHGVPSFGHPRKSCTWHRFWPPDFRKTLTWKKLREENGAVVSELLH